MEDYRERQDREMKEQYDGMVRLAMGLSSAQKQVAKMVVHDHPTRQQQVVALALHIIWEMAENVFVDGRNENAVNTAQKVKRYLIEEGIASQYFLPGMPFV